MRLRAILVTVVLGLWLAVSIAWGWPAAVIFGFFVFTAAVRVVWAILWGDIARRGGSWYYDRQLGGHHR
jgi:hypothetical protein